MARAGQFKAYDLDRKRPHKLPSPPAKISDSRLKEGEWNASRPAVVKARRSKRLQKKAASGRTPKSASAKSASDLLRCLEDQCLECDEVNGAYCGVACLRKFRRENFSDSFDIRGPGTRGYGAFTKPKVTIAKGAWLGEYLGDLRPLTSSHSNYRFEIPRVCAVDAEEAGNWTRFINSHCTPNVKPWGQNLGKRHVVLFQALKEIGPGEEIVFNYGGRYFEEAGFLCACDAKPQPHMPKGAKGTGRGKTNAKDKSKDKSKGKAAK